jgi:hypothetical protein
MRIELRSAQTLQAAGRFTVTLLALGAFLGLPSVTSASAAGRNTPIRYVAPRISGTRIACADNSARRYAPEARPRRCEFLGRLEFAGFLVGEASKNVANGSVARIALEGGSEGGIEWPFGWGQGRAWGWLAKSARTGSTMGVHAFRRVRCSDGSTWYSRVDILNENNGYYFRLRVPVCGEAVSSMPVPSPL